jgi:diaminohydroxyphosphoribosylaminopyrimidine deaminase/5-amino-6-(5-phosphoribosylamino)uracil reductase
MFANMNTDDRIFMERVFELARGAAGVTFPNPLVGAVVVSKGEIVGEGYHRGAGTPHAEVLAIQAAGERARGATLYLNLEPCCHFGRTPPCTETIARAGIERVVFSMYDPDGRMRGKGAGVLERSGIRVEEGFMRDEALELNLPYIHRSITGEPFIVLKLASTLDGRLTAGEQRWLTGEKARARVHYLRAWTESIAIGMGTLRSDDPILDRRLYREQLPPPVRMVFDTHLSFPRSHRWLDAGEPVILYCREDAPAERMEELREAGAEVVVLPGAEGGVDLGSWIADVGERGITSVFVEGGGSVATTIIRCNLFNRLVLFYAPILSGRSGFEWFREDEAPGWMERGELVLRGAETIEGDVMIVYDRKPVSEYLREIVQGGR